MTPYIRRLRWLALLLPLAMMPLSAQYPGHIESKVKTAASPRAVAVLEWTGDNGRPKRSRLVPVTVFDGQTFQDGGVYLARPQPLALQAETEYELEKAGQPEGWYDVRSAEQVAGDWLGFGGWKPYSEPAPPKLKPAREMPKVVSEGREGSGPHFKSRNSEPQNGSGAPANPPAAGSKSPSDADQTAAGKGTADAGSATESQDPEKPTLRRRTQGAGSAQSTNASSVAAEAEADPDRPRLTHNAPAESSDAPQPLIGLPPEMQQTVAVSDAVSREPQLFTYEWADPADAQKYQTEMEFMAKQAVAKAAGAPASAAMQTGAIRQPATPEAAIAARQKRWARTRTGVQAELAGVQFRAFALTYGGPATLVLTADGTTTAPGQPAAERPVTIIAQPDIYGTLQVLFTLVSDAARPEDTPRMRLVDAVDAAGDRRGLLLFELRGGQDRRFALYRVAAGRVDQVFLSDPLPTATPVT